MFVKVQIARLFRDKCFFLDNYHPETLHVPSCHSRQTLHFSYSYVNSAVKTELSKNLNS